MGCNCKQKKQQEKKLEIPQQEIVEMKQVAIDVIEQIELAIEQFNENEESKTKVQAFMKDTFGLMVGTYCDVVCKKRLKSKLEKLKSEIK